ncbi:MAG TPA: response regulator [Gemmatimonadales bacterium]|nr:response regulator [Gemmatimonadales bacterium]
MLNPMGAVGPQAAVLVVDDEAALRGLLTRVLGEAGFFVVQAEHGEDALQQLRRVGGVLNLVVTDINMPVMDGLELVRRLRPLYPNLPVLFITGRGNENPQTATCVESWGDLLRKPFSPDLLLERVAQLLARTADVGRTTA